jgi:hypothetical protein
MLFDTNQPCTVAIKSGGWRRAKMKFPSDDEQVKRMAALKITRRDLDKEKSTLDTTPQERYDAELFVRLTKDYAAENTDDFDEYEASQAIDILLFNEVVGETEELPDGVKVTLGVFGKDEEGEGDRRKVSFLFKHPRRKHMVEHQRAAITVINTRRGAKTGSEIRISIEPSMKAFRELIISTEGYAEGTTPPATHQDAAIVELFRKMGED